MNTEKTTTTPNYFTSWHRPMESTLLRLVTVNDDHRITEVVELDITELPARPDLLARLGPAAQGRLLKDARYCAEKAP